MITVYQSYFEWDGSAKSGRRAVEHALGLELLSRGLKEKYGLELKTDENPAGAVSIGKGPHGKPYLEGCPGIYFNISHCDGLAVCGIGDVALGVDVETVRLCKENLARRVLAEEELEQLAQCGEAEKAEKFIRFWTLKESYVKAVGCGLGIPLREVVFYLEAEGRIRCSVPGYSFMQQKVDKERVLSACVRGERVGEWEMVADGKRVKTGE